MRCLFLLLLCIISHNVKAQYRFENRQGDIRTYGGLTSGQIVLGNSSDVRITVGCSVDKMSWQNKTIDIDDAFDIYLESKYAYFFVRLAQRNTDGDILYDRYKLEPKNRYVISRSDNSNKVIIKALK